MNYIFDHEKYTCFLHYTKKYVFCIKWVKKKVKMSYDVQLNTINVTT